jgi:hypothetical protein
MRLCQQSAARAPFLGAIVERRAAGDGSIGTPIGNAVGYACWHVAHLLGARGAREDKHLLAAALGMTTGLKELLAERPAVEPGELSQAFWHACAGGLTPGGGIPAHPRG